ncbi:DUF2520 domain-containing protein [candidate division KSB1 bacterium]|nr:MAG: DUF2520 domain-containing protein [candidate division KSB1 bacterium]
MQRIQPIPITIIGLGAVGTALARTFAHKKIGPLILVGKGRVRERRLAREIKAKYLTDPSQLKNNGFIIICVKDSQIASISRGLASQSLPWKRLTVLHTSGTLGKEVLKELEACGAGVAAWHPYQTFPPTSREVSLKGITFGIEGNPRGNRDAFKLARVIGGVPLRVRAADRVLYHLSAVFACGFVAGDLLIAVDILKKIGLSEKRALKAVLPIAAETVKNVQKLGPAGALTGPAVRGDIKTIQKHLRALKKSDPQLIKLYRSMSRHVEPENKLR